MKQVTPVSQVLLRIEKALQDEIITDSGLKLYLSPDYDKEWKATVTAVIEALPTKVNPKHKYIYDNLEVGDEVAVSYRIVADFAFEGDGDRFMPVTEGNDYYREFVNGKGEWLRVYALQKEKFSTWVGFYINTRQELISGQQGTQSEVERWMAQFQFGKTDVYTFNNFFEYGGKNYWKADLDDIFAKKVKGHWVAVGDRVIGIPVEEEVPDQMLIDAHKGHKVKIRHQDRARLLTGGKGKGLRKDDVFSFNPRYLEKYQFGNKEYFLVQERLVDGIWN